MQYSGRHGDQLSHGKLAPMVLAGGEESERERAASQAKSIFQAGGLFEGNVNMCTAVWMLFIYCALSPLFKQSRIAHDDYLSVSFFFCLSRGVESGCNNWPLRSRISDSDQSLAEIRQRERILLWRRLLGSWEVSLAQLLYPPASTWLLLFRNISLPIVKLKRLANKINGLSLSSETGAAAAQFLGPLVCTFPIFMKPSGRIKQICSMAILLKVKCLYGTCVF
jgi:hypothetical protein